jgi:hypothetical protein
VSSSEMDLLMWVEVADIVFAKGRLAEYCRTKGVSFTEFNSFSEVYQHWETKVTKTNVLSSPISLAGQGQGSVLWACINLRPASFWVIILFFLCSPSCFPLAAS